MYVQQRDRGEKAIKQTKKEGNTERENHNSLSAFKRNKIDEQV
jgi:hypothetical protein